MDRKLILVFVLLAGCCSAQIMQQVAGTVAVLGFPSITLGVHCSHDNASGSATTVVCGPITPAVGSTIYCDAKFANGSTAPSVADNVNSGVYQPAVVPLRDAGHNYIYGSFYKENVAASATTITLTYTTTATHGQIACKEIKGVPSSYALDSTVLQSQGATGTNPANPNSYTPFANGEMMLSGAYIPGGTVGAGSGGFALLDNASTLYPEYVIQTTATATTGPFTDSTSESYAIGMAAFAPNTGGNCDSTMIFDWTGGSNTGTPTTTTLQSSTKGGQAQPNGDQLSNKVGWALKSAAGGTTYSTTGYMPLVTTRNCPFYSGSGTGTLGIDHSTAAAGGVTYSFDTQQNKVTLGACMTTTEPASTTGNIDTIEIHGGDNFGSADYINLNWSSNGVSNWQLEAQGEPAEVQSTTHWVTNTAYWIRLEYNKPQAFAITSWAINGSNQVTFTGTYTAAQYAVNDQVVISGLVHGTYMNAAVITVTGSTGTTFTGNFTHATDSSTEAGLAGYPHKVYIYTTSGSNCTGTPTLQETLTANAVVSGGGVADSFGFFDGLSLAFASGHDFYVGATAGDILYGSSLMP